MYRYDFSKFNLLNHQPQWQIPYSGSLCNSTKPLKNWLVKSLWTIARINIQPEYTIGVRHVLTNFTTGKITGNLRMSLSVTQLAHYFWFKILNHTVASYVESNKKKNSLVRNKLKLKLKPCLCLWGKINSNLTYLRKK